MYIYIYIYYIYILKSICSEAVLTKTVMINE